MLELRDYQKDALNSLYKALKKHQSALLALPTGAGKTVMMAQWAIEMLKQHKKTAIIVDRIELVKQTIEYLHNNNFSVLKEGYTFNNNYPIQVIMLQTARRRMHTLLDLKCDYIFFDEIQNYAEGQTITALKDSQRDAQIIGVSATPIDEKGYLLRGFDCCVDNVQTQDLINKHYLVEPIYYVPQNYNLDLSCIRMTGGDYNIDDLDELMANVNNAKQIYQEWSSIAPKRKTIVFCSSIKQAQVLCEYFDEQNVHAHIVHSQLSYDERENILYNFHIGVIQVLFNVGILIAGYDEPTVDCIVFANPTKVLRRYLQQAGRGLRTAPNKKNCIMLDCANIVREHGFCNDLRFFKPKQTIDDLCTVKQCPECGAIVDKYISQCPYCGYDFSTISEAISTPSRKIEIQRLQKAFDMQQQLKQQIGQLVDERGYKNGYKWYLFLDCLKSKRPTESSIRFFKRKLTQINKIKRRGYKLAYLKYN